MGSAVQRPVVVESPLSYTGAAKRISQAIQFVPIRAVLIAAAWYLVTIWYMIWLLFTAAFIWVVVPYRLLRRHQRTIERLEQVHLAQLEALAADEDEEGPPDTSRYYFQ